MLNTTTLDCDDVIDLIKERLEGADVEFLVDLFNSNFAVGEELKYVEDGIFELETQFPD